MKGTKIVGMVILAVVYFWLCQAILRPWSEVTLIKIFTCVAAGIVIFVPLYKKYFRKENE